MHRNEVAKLMDKIPQGLSPDEFLVALATHAAAYEKKRLSEEKQNPIAWMCKKKDGNIVFFKDQESLKSADLTDWEVIPLVRQL